MFCYNCGHSFDKTAETTNGSETTVMSEKAQSALDDLAAKLKNDEGETADRLALAAAERKKARVKPKLKKAETWEGVEGRSSGVFLIISLAIFLLVVAIVIFTVYWK